MEALRMDPQQRRLLECTYQAMEDAGIDIESLAGENVGVIVGISAHDYGDICMTPTEHVYLDVKLSVVDPFPLLQTVYHNTFDFRGPSFAVDTACSSSLIAMHNACRSICNDECPMACCSGVNSLSNQK
jgi:acyl transferase domain-containing protein